MRKLFLRLLTLRRALGALLEASWPIYRGPCVVCGKWAANPLALSMRCDQCIAEDREHG